MAANLGFARQYERDGYVDTLMPFFEYGRSDYTSHLGDGARGDGDQHYTGGGILYRRDRDDGLHYEAMIRAGRLSGDFKGNIDGIHASYDSDASYIAAEAGLGKIVSRENTSLDYYGKFFYTRLGSDSTVIHNSQEDNSYDFDSINSYRTRLGVRWTKEINKKNPATQASAGPTNLTATQEPAGETSTPRPRPWKAPAASLNSAGNPK